jgi:spore germination cell wall hydrolase CwlJ-like protein
MRSVFNDAFVLPGDWSKQAMKLSFLMWLATLLPGHAQEQLCLATTVYLEARDQSQLGQFAVAEVVLRRRENGRWGKNVCGVVTQSRQFAPSMMSSNYNIGNFKAFHRAWQIAGNALAMWSLPPVYRTQVVPGADHFVALNIAQPAWAQGEPVAVIGDHSFYRVGM